MLVDPCPKRFFLCCVYAVRLSKVVHRSGVRLRNHPSMSAEKALHVMEYGEVFLASE